MSSPATTSFRKGSDNTMMNSPIFEELPKATILSVTRPDVTNITPLLLSYTIEVQYKQVEFLSFFFFTLLRSITVNDVERIG